MAAKRDYTRWARDRAGRNGTADADDGSPAAESWEAPIPLGAEVDVPPFPVGHLAPWQSAWVEAEARATQTPPDLGATLVIATAGAALARKVRVNPRDKWSEPPNIMAAVALPPGERKSVVFADVLAPVQEHERELQAEAGPRIAEAASERRMLEARLKLAELAAAKAEEGEERERCRKEAKELAKELAEHVVPDPPELYCDDVTPEKLASLIARQGGRMLQASAEGTAFEIAKGRYSETANFDVYLKGHSGDPLRVGRVSRDSETVDRPALSVALAVQPDVIRGLADQATMRGRGFLARFLYSVPVSLVGRRKVAAATVPEGVAQTFHANTIALWQLPAALGRDGKPTEHTLPFSPAADHALREFEAWLEPQLADGEPLSYLAGWANKLAGHIVRIAGIRHVADAVGQDTPWLTPVSEETVRSAIEIGRYYLLPHAQVAFGMMGADPKVDDARRVLRWLATNQFRESVNCVKGVALSGVSRRDIHAGVFGGSRTAADVEAVINLLVAHHYLRPVGDDGQRRGPGRKPTERYEVNPAVASLRQTGLPLSHNSQIHRNGAPKGDAWEGD